MEDELGGWGLILFFSVDMKVWGFISTKNAK